MSKVNKIVYHSDGFLLEKFLCGVFTGAILFFVMLQVFRYTVNQPKSRRDLSVDFFQRLSERIEFLNAESDTDLRLLERPELMPDLEMDSSFHHGTDIFIGIH